MNLIYNWYYKNEQIGKECIIKKLNHGDIYIMSDKAVGNDWHKSSIYTLRHSAGPKEILDKLVKQKK